MINNRKIFVTVVFVVIGCFAGFLYWKFVSCANGTCPLKSNLYIMLFQGGIVGFLVASLIIDFFSNKTPQK